MVTEMEAILGYHEVFAMLTSQQEWVTIVVPVLICIVLVNLFFRHAFQVIWFSVKVLLAIGLYLQVKETVDNSIGILGIEAGLFGIATGAIQLSSSRAKELLRTNVISVIEGVCPGCLPPAPVPPEEPEEPIGDRAEDEDSSWMNWIRNT